MSDRSIGGVGSAASHRVARRSMRVMLLEPPLKLHGQRDVGFKEVLPHIGIGYVAAVLRNAGHDVRVVDAPAEQLTLEDVCARFEDFRPQFVGFSATTYQIHEVEDTARAFRGIDPTVRIAVGGSHASAVPKETLEAFPVLDYAVFGEGEETAAELLERIADGESPDGIEGMAHRKGDEVVVEGPRPRIRNLDALPYPAFDLFPVHRYRGFYTLFSRRFRPLTLCTTRGCPYQCNFCYKSTGDWFYTRSPESVLGEVMRDIEELGATQLVFTDEVFTMKRSHVERILTALVEARIAERAPWICQTRVDRVDPELLTLMKRAGCAVISYGIEAGNQDVLNRIAKGITLEKARLAIDWTRSAGISPDTNFIIGNAYETPATIRQTIDFAVKLDPDTASFAILSPFPGTEVADMAERGEGGLKLLSRDWRHYGKQIGSALELESVPRAELERFHRMAYRRFYLRWRKLWHVLRVVNLWNVPVYLLHNLRSALKTRGSSGGLGTWGRERAPAPGLAGA
ncbi:MAG: radical SAM protein [bacterium]